MMNHFVIANWYEGENEELGFQNANTLVKILKYYSGAEISGQVTFEDNGEPLSNVRLLVERDAFSGEDAVDNDEKPTGFQSALLIQMITENGHSLLQQVTSEYQHMLVSMNQQEHKMQSLTAPMPKT